MALERALRLSIILLHWGRGQKKIYLANQKLSLRHIMALKSQMSLLSPFFLFRIRSM